MSSMILLELIYFIPMAAIVFFFVSLYGYIGAKKQYKAEPTATNEQKKKATKTLLIAASVIMGILLVVVIGFMVLMYTAVAYM